MKNMMQYKGYYGSVNFDADDLIFYGKIEFINALISYEGESAQEINQAFHDAIDDYLETCRLRAFEPEKPFKGSLNIRIGRDLHEKAAIIAKNIGCPSLNDFIKQALNHEIKKYA